MITLDRTPLYRQDARLIALMIHNYYDLEKKIENPRRSSFLKDDYREQRKRLLVFIPQLIARWEKDHGETMALGWTDYTEGLFWQEVRRYLTETERKN